MEVRLHAADSGLEVTVMDNGRGFDPGSVASDTTKKGMGLMSMGERAGLLGGSLSAQGSPVTGCQVILYIPLQGRRELDLIRVVVADDHTLFRKGIRTILEQMQGLEVVGEAANGQEVVTQARELVPDAILMDIQMPVISGIEATQQILKGSRPVKWCKSTSSC